MTPRPYYDHDPIWRDRARHGTPLWGAYSPSVYGTLLKLLQTHRPAPARVLDAGCGAGAFGRVLAGAGYAYTGVDESAEATRLGREHFPELTLARCDLALPGACVAGGPFDVVTAVNVLHCLVEDDERHRFLTALKIHAAAGGLLLLTTMCAPALPEHRPSKTPRRYAALADLRAALAAAGWAHILHEDHQEATPARPIANWTVAATGGVACR
jgi:2-polyprenyl-3-methyl-5-hydroxy-6-metoxy-1,4-benzoquinol methylase